jgi:hypothetical protein
MTENNNIDYKGLISTELTADHIAGIVQSYANTAPARVTPDTICLLLINLYKIKAGIWQKNPQ